MAADDEAQAGTGSPGTAPGDDGWLDDEFRRLLAFGRDIIHPDGGAAWLDDDGRPDLDRPVHSWITRPVFSRSSVTISVRRIRSSVRSEILRHGHIVADSPDSSAT